MKNGFESKTYPILISILFVLVGLFLLTPSLLSTRWGTEILVRAINKRIEGKLSVEHLSLRMFSKQEITGLLVVDEQNQTLIKCPDIKIANGCWSLLFSRDLGVTIVNHPEFFIRKPFQPIVKLPQPLQQAAFSPEIHLKSLKYPVAVDLNVIDGQGQVISPGLDPIDFTHLNIHLIAPKNRDNLLLKLDGETLQQEVAGKMAIDAKLEHLRSTPQVQATAMISNLPVRGVDQVIGFFRPDLNGLFLNVIGPTLNLNLLANLNQNKIDLDLKAESEKFNADILAVGDEGIVHLKEPAIIKATLTPALIKRLSLDQTLLRQNGWLQVKLNQLTLPIDDFSKLQFQGNLETSPLDLIIDQQAFSVDRLSIEAAAIEDLTFSGILKAHGVGFKTDLDAEGLIHHWKTNDPSGSSRYPWTRASGSFLG